MRVLISITLSLCLLVFAASARATKLNVRVEHLDSVEPVESDLEPGKVFTKKSLPDNNIEAEANNWYEIPKWLAGYWHKESQTDYYRHSYLTGTTDNTRLTREARSDGRWGTQAGLGGQIWQFDGVPYSQTVDADDETIVQIVRMSECLESSEERFVKRSIETQLRVDKLSGKIKTVESGEEITILSPESDTMIKRETSSKVFDQSGKPVLLALSETFETKIGPFEPQNFYHGQDMKKLFQEFMKKSGILGEQNPKSPCSELIAQRLVK